MIKIITIHLNNYKGFEKTYYSVLPLLNNANFSQWIIKDGNSKEIELVYIQKCLDKLNANQYQLVQKVDSGIYDAMNQALELVDNNDRVLFLNCGDELSEQFIKNYDMLNTPKADILYADTLMRDKLVKAPESLDFAFFLGKTINHQSLIIKGFLLKKYLFNTHYKIVADWILLFELLKNESLIIKKLNFPICIYEGGGISEQQDDLRRSERQQYLNSKYSEWELESLEQFRRIRQRPWFDFIIKALDSPKRGSVIQFIGQWLK